MDLLRVPEVMRRHWVLTLVGLALGCALAFTVSFTVARDARGGIAVRTRSRTTYETEAQLLVSAPDWSIGRAGLERTRPDAFSRTVYLAPTYATFVTSDLVRRGAEASIGPIPETFEAEPLNNSPIIKIKASGADPAHLVKATDAVFRAFNAYLKEQQTRYEIPAADRLSVSVLASPSPPVPIQSRTLEIAAIAFMAPLIAVVALEFVLERNRIRRAARVDSHDQAA